MVWPRLSASLSFGRVAEVVGEQRLVAVDLPVDGLGVGVEQQLRRVAAVPVLGVVGAVHPVAVALAGLDARQVGVPDERVVLAAARPGSPCPSSSIRQSSTFSATSENSAKLAPAPSYVAPRG